MASVNGKKPHVLVVAFPAQGHVTPLMKLSRLLAKQGIKVTIVNTEEIHKKIVAANDINDEQNDIVLTSVPDGLDPEEDSHTKGLQLLESLKNTMPRSLMEIIQNINFSNRDENISCIIVDITLGGSVLDIAEEVRAKPVIFNPTSAATFAVTRNISKLVDQGYLDTNGTFIKSEIILSDDIPAWGENQAGWSFPYDLNIQKIFLEKAMDSEKTVAQAKYILCNTFNELESSALNLNPNMLAIGPLLQLTNSLSSFHHEDDSCLKWLNEKPIASVIYVSFGSLAIFSQQQLDELALGLELSGRPFLWVVRSDLANGSRAEFPNGFLDRVSGGVGKIVEWAPQEKVLSHSSIACFLSHCGWNSTLEGLTRGIPFLTWPYIADQIHNQNYICDKWKIGLRIEPDKNGIKTRDEIKRKIEMALSDDNLKINAQNLKAMAQKSISEGGSSSKNLERFTDYIRE